MAHLIIDTSSTNENENGECDFCLVTLTAEYIAYLLGYMDEVRRLHRADDSVYNIECWDGRAAYFPDSDWFQELRDIDGNLAADLPRGEPILLPADSQFDDADFQRLECQTVQIVSEDLWWTAYVKHSNIRIESAHVDKKTLLKILRSLGGTRKPCRPARSNPNHPAIRRIHDLLYLDMKNGQESYDPEKPWDADVMAAIAEVVAKYIPRPPQSKP